MRLRRGPREVYRVYGEDEAPDVDVWSGAEAPTREFAVPSDESAPRPKSHARLVQLRRVAVMTLLGVGVGLVAALALHSLRGSAVVDGRRTPQGGPARAALLPSTSPLVPVATASTGAHTSRIRTAFGVGVGRERHPATSVELGGVARSRHPHGVAEGHASRGPQAARSQTHPGSSASISEILALADSARYRGPATEAVMSVQPSAEAAASEFTFER